jgi:hypothetical protein
MSCSPSREGQYLASNRVPDGAYYFGRVQYDDETERGCIRFAPAFRKAATDGCEMDDYVFALDTLLDWRGALRIRNSATRLSKPTAGSAQPPHLLLNAADRATRFIRSMVG